MATQGFLLRTYAGGGDGAYNPSCAMIASLSTQDALYYLNLIKQLRTLQAGNDNLYSLELWDYRTFISWEEASASFKEKLPLEIETLLDDLEDVLLLTPEQFEILEKGMTLRTECNTVHINNHGIRWEAYAKHTDISMATTELSEKYLQAIIEKKEDR